MAYAPSEATFARLHFLWSAAHTMFPVSPNLSALYMSEFKKNAAEVRLNLADGVRRIYCSYCGSIFVPGVNCKVWVGENGFIKKKRSRVKKTKKVQHRKGNKGERMEMKMMGMNLEVINELTNDSKDNAMQSVTSDDNFIKNMDKNSKSNDSSRKIVHMSSASASHLYHPYNIAKSFEQVAQKEEIGSCE
ncbi:6395_t:CDS:2 [Ambispora gerdemannii]|uniref:6395_t:CDS:1 n=1 Tax=Ambispora gerdemannii TaxID=144530 RepID=A0A9N8ZA82_9GLOM|nr:6395_t:CDS:2 [Ambispora gerdemannii]